MTSFGIVIPARLGSTRLPNKPLLEIGGKPLVVRVLEAARRSRADFVVVAADDPSIVEIVAQAGGEAILTSPEHPSGTDRIAEVVRLRNLPDDTLLVNWQGDEPLLEPSLVDDLAKVLAERRDAAMATLATPITSVDDLFSPHVVKVVLDRAGYARTFSRAPIPWARDAFGTPFERPQGLPEGPFLRHIGLYAYRARTLLELAGTRPPDWERSESLEQLRALWLGMSIHVSVVDEAPRSGVDTREDLARVEEILRPASF